jgi:fatty-acyl-CoA synthase
MGPKRTTPRFESFDDALRYQAAQSSTSRLVFAEQDNRKIGYPELLRLAARMAAGLQSLGIAAGARVALVMTPSAETVAALIALLRLQATTVPLVYRGRLRPGSQPFVASEQTLRMNQPELLLSPRQELPSYETLTAGLPHVMRTEPIEALAEGPSEQPMQSRCEPWLGPALIQMSSGSTAISKAIWLTESNLLSNVAAIHERLDGSASDNVFCWLPLNHDMGLVGGLLTTLYAGASLTLGSPQKFIQDPVSWIAGMSQDRSTTTMGPPSAYALSREKAVLAPERLADCDLSNLRVAMVGAEPVSHSFCSAFQETMSQYGLRHNVLQPCYGLAENCVAVTLREPFAAVAVRHFDRTALEQSRLVLAADASPQAVTLVGNGPAVRGSEVLIGEPQAGGSDPGVVGEIHIRGSARAARIVCSDGTPIEPSSDGWIPTGDLGAWVDGELYIVGRTKEIIKRGGATLAPFDIESTVAELVGVSVGAVAAVGLPDEETGREEVIVLIEGSRKDASELETKIRLGVLQTFHLPLLDVLFIRPGMLARTMSGKVKRAEVRRAYQDGRFSRPARGS